MVPPLWSKQLSSPRANSPVKSSSPTTPIKPIDRIGSRSVELDGYEQQDNQAETLFRCLRLITMGA